jgi:hypothetical protein
MTVATSLGGVHDDGDRARRLDSLVPVAPRQVVLRTLSEVNHGQAAPAILESSFVSLCFHVSCYPSFDDDIAAEEQNAARPDAMDRSAQRRPRRSLLHAL